MQWHSSDLICYVESVNIVSALSDSRNELKRVLAVLNLANGDSERYADLLSYMVAHHNPREET